MPASTAMPRPEDSPGHCSDVVKLYTFPFSHLGLVFRGYSPARAASLHCVECKRAGSQSRILQSILHILPYIPGDN